MNVALAIDTSAYKDALNKAQPTPQQKQRALGRAASGYVLDMEKRVDKGVGLYGRMKPYHPKYAEYRNSRGRRTDIVDLQFTGQMLADMGVVSLSPTKAVISFSQQKQRIKAISNQRKRPWFGVNDSEHTRILSRYKREIFR